MMTDTKILLRLAQIERRCARLEDVLFQRLAAEDRADEFPLLATPTPKAMPSDLNDKQARFVEEYLIDLNATQAAIRAGYATRTARTIGHENMAKPAIALAIQTAQAERSLRTATDAAYVVENLRETVERCMQHTPGPNGERGNFDARGATAALRQLGLHLGMFRERAEVTSQDERATA
jgi:phage terminase small subunit